MEEKKKDIRTGSGGLFQPHLREVTGDEPGRTIEGYAIVFEEQSVLMNDYWTGPFREIIHKGAITQEMLDTSDIKMTIWHNRERLIARSNKGTGTLKLTVDEKGVKYSFEAPHTPDGETALELVKRGDLAGSSFTYWSDEKSSVSYTKEAEDVLLRHVNRIDCIYEMTIASDPAYQQTSVSAREIEEVKLQFEPANDKQYREDSSMLQEIINR